ncbi:PREDICTED: tripartite motif-containing protein 3-like [Branchiostoma belcheri]|uniref:Tripartite motif-containing protein 3-like n=1 Tax=Branchiostoma belcheri TaxID=7741 RepID=A0A6P4YIA5_BRABE|nr:PREDICTED: tripartite motif-containing protein 3-like [Branchiostoma belcheri]
MAVPSSLATQTHKELSVSNCQEQESPRVTFGGKGRRKGRFDGLRGVTVSDKGEIFVADSGNQRIQVFTLKGRFVRQFPTVVSFEQEMYPLDVATDKEGNLWVVGETRPADFAVQYSRRGRVLRKIDLRYTGDRSSGGVAVDTRRNHILVTQTIRDWKTHGEVQVLRPDGTCVRTVGRFQGMKDPQYITVDRRGNIIVSDVCTHSVYVYKKDGQFLLKFGDESLLKHYIYGICTDRSGNIIVAVSPQDASSGRVDMFDKTGRFVRHITTDMRLPWTVAMATQGQLVVTDYDRNTVSIFTTTEPE